MNVDALPIVTPRMSRILAHEVLFVINPNSGKQAPHQIVERLERYDAHLAYVITQDQQGVRKVFQNLDKKYKGIVIVGGDGTINASLRYLVENKNLVLAVLPNGSGNGFARELGFDRDLDALMRSFRKGETMDLDVLEINGDLAINVSGLGMDSYVAHHFQKSKGRGFVNYVWATARAMIQFRDFEAEIKTKEDVYQGKYRMIAIANTRQFGNNAIIAPQARPDDGRYDLVLVKPFPIWKYAEFIIKMFSGKLQSSKYLQFLSLDDASQIKWSNTKYHLDGEPKETQHDLHIQLFSEKVKVLKRV